MPHSVPQSRPTLPIIEQVLLGLLLLGFVAILSLPAARGTGGAFGWMPLWLLGWPATGLATAVWLRRARDPARAAAPARPGRRHRVARTGRRVQAVATRRPRLPRAA